MFNIFIDKLKSYIKLMPRYNYPCNRVFNQFIEKKKEQAKSFYDLCNVWMTIRMDTFLFVVATVDFNIF